MSGREFAPSITNCVLLLSLPCTANPTPCRCVRVIYAYTDIIICMCVCVCVYVYNIYVYVYIYLTSFIPLLQGVHPFSHKITAARINAAPSNSLDERLDVHTFADALKYIRRSGASVEIDCWINNLNRRSKALLNIPMAGWIDREC